MSGFKASARAVDMLGRQQIAGAPTAVSELFKNAHDAYATEVRADFVRADSLFVLRDNGIGMSREAFETRWLVLATSSKVGQTRREVTSPPAGMEQRPLLGEKGVGRLAIAVLGETLLIVSKDRRHPTVCALISWSLFALADLTLEQIRVPILEHRGPVDAEVVRKLRAELVEHIDDLAERGVDGLTSVRASVDGFDVDPAAFERKHAGPSIAADGHGTQFYICPTDEQLTASIDEPPHRDALPPLVSTLIGFSDTVLPGASEPLIAPSFFDETERGEVIERISGDNFISPEEFAEADHRVSGRFDEFGDFSGTVELYGGQETIEYRLPYQGAERRQLGCGAFEIRLAVLQGDPKASRLDPVAHSSLNTKLSTVGGVYVYRDGIRVLPYGGPEVDWLDIERQRSLQAGRAYFSYRRMFGGVLIDHEHNAALTEKAGREGFRENKSFREFRDVLRTFFRQLARDVFVPGGTEAGTFLALRDALTAERRAQAERDVATRAAQARLKDELSDLATISSPVLIDSEIARIEQVLASRLSTALSGPEVNRATRLAEQDARDQLTHLRATLRPPTAQGIGLTEALRREMTSASLRFDRIVEERLEPASLRIAAAVDQALAQKDQPALAIQRTAAAIEKDAKAATATLATNARNQIADAARQFELSASSIRERSNEEIDRVLRAVNAVRDVDLARRQMDSGVAPIVDGAARSLEALTSQVAAIADRWQADEDLAILDPVELLESQVIELKQLAESNLDLAQLGMAVEIVRHELNHSVRSIRRNLRDLGGWARENPELAPLYDELRGAFEHLDSYLNLFEPLQRRLSRRKVIFTGGEIADWLAEAFASRLSAASLAVSPSFRAFEIEGYRSTFFPAFANLVDNGLYWATSSSSHESPVVELDASGSQLFVRDNGPGIDEHDAARIFELWWTTRRAGRGAGLYLTRAALGAEGWQVSVVPHGPLGGAEFVLEATGTDSA